MRRKGAFASTKNLYHSSSLYLEIYVKLNGGISIHTLVGGGPVGLFVVLLSRACIIMHFWGGLFLQRPPLLVMLVHGLIHVAPISRTYTYYIYT